MQDYPEQYNILIDEETWAFIKTTETYYPADAVNSSIADQRLVYNQMCEAFNIEHPRGINTTDSTLELSTDELDNLTVAQRLYANSDSPSETLILFFHGGGFVVGDLESHDSVCADMAKRTGLDVLATDYRLLPEHAPLAAYFDCWGAYNDACNRYNSIVLVGDSAGGNLCAAIAHSDRNRRTANPSAVAHIKGQVLIYPGLGGDLDSSSAIAHSHAPMLTLADLEFYDNLRLSRTTDDYRLAPLRDGNFEHLPPTVCISAECDPLADDGKLYCDRIEAAGGVAAFFRETGLVHGYLRARHSVGRASKSFDRICESIVSLAH